MRINVKNIIAALCVAAGAFSLAYADVPLPKVKILGKTFYYYETQKDESLYGIAKKFGLDPEILAATNREVSSTPDKGTLLYYPVGKESEVTDVPEIKPETTSQKTVTNSDTNSPLYHTVTSDESLYGIANKYGLSVDRLTALNPQINNGSIHEGMLLRLREDEPVVIHKPVDTSSTVFPVTVASVESDKINNNNDLQYDSVVPDTLTFSDENVLPSSDKIAEQGPVNVAIVLTDLGTTAEEKRVKKNKEMEFSRGALTAVDDMKDSGSKINLTIIDGSKGQDVIKQSLDSFSPRLIITTSDKTAPDYLINYADSTSTLMLNAFDARDDRYLTDKNVIQYLTPSSYMNREVAEYIATHFNDYTLLVAGSIDPNDMLGQAIIERFTKLGLDRVEEINIEELPQLKLPDDDDKYLIYGTQTAQADVKALLDNVTSLRNRYVLADIRVLGRPNWIQHTSKLKEELGSNYTFIPSRFYFNPENETTKEFIDHYDGLFSLRPMKAYPVYCATAYDIMTTFVPNLTANPNLEGNAFVYVPTVQSPISFERIENGGVVNRGVYLINLMPFGMSDVVLISE